MDKMVAMSDRKKTSFSMTAEMLSASQKLAKSRQWKRASAKKQEQNKLRAYRKNKLFRRIEADIKERDRRRVPGRPEEYVDRDRVISVNIGPQDIRTSMLKQRMFLSKTHVFMQEEQQGYKVFVEQAAHEMHKAAYDRALTYLNRAIRLNLDDPLSVIERGACFVGLQRYDEALEDAEHALEAGLETSKAYTVKGDALYHMGNFEHSLVFHYRALQRCTSNSEEESIRSAIKRTTEAVENAVGMRASGHFLAMPAVLNRIPTTIFGMPWHELKALSKVEDTKIEDIEAKAEAAAAKFKRKKQRRNLLGKLSTDLDYLEGLLSEVKVCDTTDDDTDKYVTKQAEEAISFLKDRQEFWSQFKPVYSK